MKFQLYPSRLTVSTVNASTDPFLYIIALELNSEITKTLEMRVVDFKVLKRLLARVNDAARER
jgi:hypothetical protein